MGKLTDKQQAFVMGKASGLKNRDAAIQAGYAPNNAGVQAAQMLARADIKSAIAKAKKQLKEHAASLGVTLHTEGDDNDTGKDKMPKAKYDDSLDFLKDVMNHGKLPIGLRMDAAKQLLPYQHARLGEKGKKEKANDRAKEIAQGRGRFGTKTPPKLVAVQGGKQ